MSRYTTTSSRPNEWVRPRPHRDASQRLHTSGPLQSMDRPPSPYRGTIRLVLLLVVLCIAVALFCEALAGIVRGMPA